MLDPKIEQYLKSQTTIPLEQLKHDPIKTKEQFLNNYKQHDQATQYVALEFLKNNFSLHPIGKDHRNTRVFIENETPDYFLEKIIDLTPYEIPKKFCLDIKSKSSYHFFGYVNLNAFQKYKKFSQACNMEVFLIFCLISKDSTNQFNPVHNLGYSSLSSKIKSTIKAKDGNKVLILEWKKGLPYVKY